MKTPLRVCVRPQQTLKVFPFNHPSHHSFQTSPICLQTMSDHRRFLNGLLHQSEPVDFESTTLLIRYSDIGNSPLTLFQSLRLGTRNMIKKSTSYHKPQPVSLGSSQKIDPNRLNKFFQAIERQPVCCQSNQNSLTNTMHFLHTPRSLEVHCNIE